MSDPIQGINTAPPVGMVSTGEAGAAPSSDAAAQAPAAAVPVDQANVGETEALLTQIAQAASAVPTIDQAKVSTLQQEIAAGTYRVDPQQIAQKMLQLDPAAGAGGGNR